LAALWDRRFFRSTRGRIVTLLRRSGRTVEGLARELGDGGFVIRGYSCPLTSVVRDHPEACRIAEALLTELTGLPIHEHCDRDESSPRCCFEVANPQAAEGE
jgi:predicted ArsR family transcriptional regulator